MIAIKGTKVYNPRKNEVLGGYDLDVEVLTSGETLYGEITLVGSQEHGWGAAGEDPSEWVSRTLLWEMECNLNGWQRRMVLKDLEEKGDWHLQRCTLER